MEEVAEDGKESTNSARANGMNESVIGITVIVYLHLLQICNQHVNTARKFLSSPFIWL
jgi:hypothetical protein